MLFATALVALATVSGVFPAPVLFSTGLERIQGVVQRRLEARGLLDSLHRPLPNTDPVQPPPADGNSGNLVDILHRPLPPGTDPVQPPPAEGNIGNLNDILHRPLPPSTDPVQPPPAEGAIGNLNDILHRPLPPRTDLEERDIGKDDVCYPPLL